VGKTAYPLVQALVKEVYKAGGQPYVNLSDSSISREIVKECSEEQLSFRRDYELMQMKGMDAYIAVRASDNVNELADIDADKLQLYQKELHPVTEYRVSKTKWVILRYPNYSMAQLANTSLASFEDFYFDVCNLDYSKMSKAMDPLVTLMNKTDKVRLVGRDTDLSFSIKDIPAIKCDGIMNIPDGEVFTAPVKDSVNGTLHYSCPSVYQGFKFEDIRLTFKDGKIIGATANDTERINKVFDTDEGARYVGEFAIGVNPYILTPMLDTLFDEKIMGSFHFTPGKCYDDASNGNKSSIHWDLVNIQTPEHGGGEIYFDDVLIRKDGVFVIDELKGLNPENLK
jgi:aminopeptidase